MPISRPLLIALVAAVLAVVAFYATQGSRDSTGGAPGAVAPPPTAATDAATARPGDGASPGSQAKHGAAGVAARKADAAQAAVRRRARAERRGMPPTVARALDARKTVVLFFRGSGSADDHATARAVDGLRGQRGVVVLADRIGRLGRYRAVVGELGISQAPAVVIVDRTRAARVVEGYVDPATLAQDVADAR
jgi:hypothetical protein